MRVCYGFPLAWNLCVDVVPLKLQSGLVEVTLLHGCSLQVCFMIAEHLS